MSGKKEKKSINLVGTSKSRKKVSAKSKRRNPPKRKSVRARGRARSTR